MGDSSTGKTRACWEAVRALPDDWRVWQPTSGAAVLEATGRIGPRTVLWLDEIKRPLLSGDHAADERVSAGEHAEGGHIIQYLAGGPAQLERYENAPPLARAVLDAAVDARRLAPGIRLTVQFLAAAGDASLMSLKRDLLSDNWFTEVIAYTCAPSGPWPNSSPRPQPNALPIVPPRSGIRADWTTSART